MRAACRDFRRNRPLTASDGDASILVQRAKGNTAGRCRLPDRRPCATPLYGNRQGALADLDFRQRGSRRGRGPKKFAAKTITRADRLREELRAVRAQGYAFDDRELHDDMRCVSVPVFEKNAVTPTGISISGPRSRFTMARLKESSRRDGEGRPGPVTKLRRPSSTHGGAGRAVARRWRCPTRKRAARLVGSRRWKLHARHSDLAVLEEPQRCSQSSQQQPRPASKWTRRPEPRR